MFILIPVIFIFLLLSYIYLNNLSKFTQGFIYILIVIIILISSYLYKKIKNDLKQQEINALDAELLTLKKKLQTTEDEKEKNTVKRKINSVKEEIRLKL